MIDNDTIITMMGGKVDKDKKPKTNNTSNWESQIIDGFKNKNTQTDKKIDPMNPSVSSSDLGNVGDTLKNIPPLLIIAIVLLVVPSFFPQFWYSGVIGMFFMVAAILDKIIPKENKERAKLRIGILIAKWKLKRLQKQIEKENGK